MSATLENNNLASELRRRLPEAFSKLSKEQVTEFCELLESYATSRDPEVLEVMVEYLVPASLGNVLPGVEVSPEAAADVDRFQAMVGKAIREERVKRGWTQEELAKRAGVKQSHICRLEKGNHTPTHLTIQRIADAFGISPAMLDIGW